MKRSHYLLALSLAFISLIGCDALVSVQGRVVDKDGRPVVGASVRLTAIKSGKAREMKTAGDGSFSLSLTHGFFPGRFQLSISKPGYLPYAREFEPKTRSQISVVLKGAGPPLTD